MERGSLLVSFAFLRHPTPAPPHLRMERDSMLVGFNFQKRAARPVT